MNQTHKIQKKIFEAFLLFLFFVVTTKITAQVTGPTETTPTPTPTPSGLPGKLDDGLAHAVPSLTMPALGQTYIDPVYGTKITRVSNDYPRAGDGSAPYAKNGYWNADGTRVIHVEDIINPLNGNIVVPNIPLGQDDTFDPVNPDIYYVKQDSSLKQGSLSTGVLTTIKTFSGTLGQLGSSVDWVDSSGRYFLLSIGESLRIWDKQTDTLYAGSIPNPGDGGWSGISPDGNWVVVAGGLKTSYRVDHTAKTLSTSGTMFWNLCGDHGDLVSASNGKTYFVTNECHSEGAVYAVDISIAQTTTNLQKQRSDNRKLFEVGWNEDGHFSGVSKGPRQDWVLYSNEWSSHFSQLGTDYTSIYKNEILMINVLTGEVRRLAHHRSNVDGSDVYCSTPRIDVDWTGTKAMFVSNFGLTPSVSCGYGDLYIIYLTDDSIPTPTPSPIPTPTPTPTPTSTPTSTPTPIPTPTPTPTPIPTPTPTPSPIPTPTPSTKFSLNNRVIATDNIQVRSTPAGTSLGIKNLGSIGTVIGGPTRATLSGIAYWWWNINFDSGIDGWVAEDFLVINVAPTPISTPTPTISNKFSMGDWVTVTTNKLNVRNTPGGTKFGTQQRNSQGTIISGPVAANGYVWWQINYDKSPDGWSVGNYLRK